MPKYQADDFINHRYKVIRLLGQGAMGEVYLVEDMIKVDRLVALKVLNSENLDEADFWSKGEYEALTRLRHPNLARVYDFARIHDSSDFYIVSEFIHGEDLFSAIRGMNSEEVLDVIAQICRSLEYIHTQGYVHFDVKPDNILVTRQRSAGHDESSKVEWNPNVPSDSGSDLGSGPPRAKLIDFGLAEQITGTFNFAIKGTFHYVAPEIIRGQTPDKRADLYSLGVTIFQILTDYLPFVDASGATMDRSKLNWREEIRRSLGAHPSYLADILCRLLEDDPDDRFSSARAIIQALNAGSGQHFEIETAETQISYLYCSRVVGRRKELNRLREESELVFSVLPGGNRQPTGETSVVSQLLRDGRKRPPLFMLSGEIGVGKTRLIGEFKHTLKMREIPVHTGNCYETNHDAYHPFREIMEQLGLDLGLESDVFQKHKAAVCRLCPKLRSSEATEDEGAGFRPDKERLFFIDSLASFMIDAAAVKPCVFDVNNLHWADEATAELLGHLIDRIVNLEENLPTPIPLMIVGTMRSDETLPDPVRTLLSKLREDESIREMPVHRFTRPQIAELIHNMLQIEEIPTPFLDRLEERTAGNPLFIVETLKGLQEEGIIAREGDRWRVRGDGDLRRIEIPHGIEAILLRRVRMLDEQQQRVLETMSAYDKPISGRFLEHFPEFARIDVMSCLRELENRGMVVKSLDAGRVQFSIEQPKLREILYENIPDDRRQILHGVLADALFSEYGDRDDDVVEDLAYHYQRSDRVGKSLEFTLRAGDICRKVFAHDRAVTHFRHVIQQVEGHPDHTRVWYDTHEKIGDIGTLSGNFEVARSSYDTLLDVEYR
ncbi:MAG: protein kinase, partial [Planctomycetota bacterium]